MPGRLNAESAAPTDPRPERIGLVGCGRRGIQLASQLLDSNPSAKLVALADVLPDALQRCARSLNGKYRNQVDIPRSGRFTGIAADVAVLDAEIDTLVIAGCPADRPRHIESAIRRGLHVVSARPIAVCAEGLSRFDATRATAARQGLKLEVPCDLVSNANVQQSIRRIHGGGIGRLLSLRALVNARPLPAIATRANEPTEVNRVRNWQHFPTLSGGGPLEELADRLWLCNEIAGGPPLAAQGIGSASAEGAMLDRLAVEMDYGSIGLHAFWRRSSVDFSGCTLSAHGTEGWCDVLAGKVFDHDNHLLWSSGSDSGSAGHFGAEGAFAATLAAIMAREAALSGKRISRSDFV
ncbi:MAG: hypothetical protein Aurels2KO_11620 [Aureliella sp.]